MTTTTNLIACPDEKCLTFPFDRQADVDAHVASGSHVYETTRRAFGRGETPAARPVSTGTSTAPRPSTVKAPTDPQVAYLRTLLDERKGVTEAEAIRADLNAHRQAGTLSGRIVSKAIDALLQIAKAPRVETARPADAPRPGAGTAQAPLLDALPAGRYFVDGTFVKVERPTKGNWDGFVFVKRQPHGPDTDGVRFAIRNPKAATVKVDEGFRPLLDALLADPKAAAVEFGHRTGSCCVCARTLTDPESIAKGIGPICEAKF